MAAHCLHTVSVCPACCAAIMGTIHKDNVHRVQSRMVLEASNSGITVEANDVSMHVCVRCLEPRNWPQEVQSKQDA